MLVKIEMPTDVNEISLFQYQDWMENPTDIKRKIAIFLKLEYEQVDIIQDEYVAEINEELDELLNTPRDYSLSVIINGEPYNFIQDLNKITFGEYIDICRYITDVNEWHRLMAVVFKPQNVKDYEGTESIKDTFLNMPMGEVTASVYFLSLFLQEVQLKYPEIYDGGTSEGAEAVTYFSKWGWYATIKVLAKNKPWKVKKITDMNIHEIHTFLAADIDEKKFKHKLLTQKGDTENTIYL